MEMVTIPKVRLENLESKETHLETLKLLGLEQWQGYFTEDWTNNEETKKHLLQSMSDM